MLYESNRRQMYILRTIIDVTKLRVDSQYFTLLYHGYIYVPRDETWRPKRYAHSSPPPIAHRPSHIRPPHALATAPITRVSSRSLSATVSNGVKHSEQCSPHATTCCFCFCICICICISLSRRHHHDRACSKTTLPRCRRRHD